jgi:hypothetical protein
MCSVMLEAGAGCAADEVSVSRVYIGFGRDQVGGADGYAGRSS